MLQFPDDCKTSGDNPIVASDMKKPAPTERVRWLKPSMRGQACRCEQESSIGQAWPGVVAGGDESPGQLAHFRVIRSSRQEPTDRP